MLSKYLEKKIEIIIDENTRELCQPIQLEYYLIESEDILQGEPVYHKAFGVEIVKKYNHTEERKIIRNVSFSRENTKKILDLLAVNTVTPIELSFVLDDMIGI